MCGINAIFAYGDGDERVDRHELLRTRDSMTARGPDGFGEYIGGEGRVGLGHRRLAIIDLSDAASQPMESEDGRFSIVFNGEIYNYRDLRRSLSAKGVRFRTESDTEVILELFRRDREKMLGELRGMFAFVIWDEKERTLFLARDPYGIKPLFFFDNGKTFRLASQMKALRAGGTVPAVPSPGGVVGFLLWGSVPEPLSIIRGVRMLPAGTYMWVGRHGPSNPVRYWSIAEAVAASCEGATIIPLGSETSVVTKALHDSVEAHMVADVPVGAFLSGGLDSATVVGLAQEVSEGTLETITLTFDDFVGSPNDEAPVARDIAQHLGVRYHECTVDMQKFEAEWPRFLEAMDQPTIDGFNTWLVSKYAKEAGLKVVLSGLGGDELFGGYPTFQTLPERIRAHRRLAYLPLFGRAYRDLFRFLVRPLFGRPASEAAVYEYGRTFNHAYHLSRGVFMPWELPRLLDPAFAKEGLADLAQSHPSTWEEVPEDLCEFAKVAVLESSRYMRNQLLRDTDWAGMAHSLEIRVPLVDRVLTEKVIGLAALGRLGQGKSVLSRVLRNGLPSSATTKPKTGFTIPIWRWLRKSPHLNSWRRIKMLRRADVSDTNRLSYSLLSQMRELQGILH